MKYRTITSLLAVLALISATGTAGLPTPPPDSPPGSIPSLTGGLPAQIAGANKAKVGGEYKSENLYTPRDPNASGGISLTTSAPVESAFAVPQSNQYFVYKGTVGADKKTVSFSGLPIAKYDLMLVCVNTIYEGFCLNRDEDNLTPEDKKFINVTVGQSIPFFDFKRLERMKGTTGTAGKATVVLQEMRIDNFLNQNGDFMKGHQLRSIKLAFCEDVGKVGWQMRQTREVIRTDVFPDMPHGPLPIKFLETLEGIRVTTAVKDLGKLELP
jgi:hypothetical protein